MMLLLNLCKKCKSVKILEEVQYTFQQKKLKMTQNAANTNAINIS